MAELTLITCPECTKKFKGKSDLAGKKVKCPACGQPFVVPGGAKAKPQAKPPAVPEPPPSRAPGSPSWDEDEGPANYDVNAQDLTPRCPHCAKELLSADAVVCIYCGYNVLTRTMGQTTKAIAHTFGDYFLHLLPGLGAGAGILFLLALYIYYCLIWPSLDFVRNSWIGFTTHESMRFWPGAILLGVIWGLGMFAYKRLILNPLPPENVKD